jgi:hypothetical protein
MFLLQMVIQVILSSVQQSAFATWKEAVVVVYEQFVLDHCVQLNITHVSLPKGGTGKKCDYVDTERFLKDKLCIIQIQNKDIMCCARAIVTAKARLRNAVMLVITS